ncbi:MAG: M14 family zinc carboxypeptidase, partial [Bacteroidota bacterium]
MNSPFRILPFFLFILVVASCNRGATDFVFPTPVDTSTRAISLQDKRSYDFPTEGLSFDNKFDGARLNGVEQLTATSYVVSIEPENEPINPSPWYAFRIQAERDKRFTVHLTYDDNANHRYFPKVSADRKTWVPVDSTKVLRNINGKELYVMLEMRAGETLYLAGQEVINSADVLAWAQGLSQHPNLSLRTVGQSKLGRDLLRLDLRSGEAGKRPTIVLFSRQHPPEVTGFLAFQSFIDGLLAHPRLGEFLDNYQVLIYPLMNPDGVDLGHWRHNAGGIDPNRDWAFYRQPEAYAIANDVVTFAKGNRSKVVLGMDFHSTWADVYYTHNDAVEPKTALPGFKDAWLAGIEREIGGDFKINEEAEPIGKP